jgi:hypothetical protein
MSHARSMSSHIVIVGSVPPSFTLGKGVWAIGARGATTPSPTMSSTSFAV